MSAENDRIFPILDRDTPIIDRLRERREQMRNSSSAKSIGRTVARSALTGEPPDEEFLMKIRADIAEELDIPEDQISGMFISQLRGALSPTLEELVNQQGGLGNTQTQEDNSESEEESEDNNPLQQDESEETQQETEEEESSEENTGPAFPDDSMDEDSEDDEGESESEEIF